MTRKLVIGFLIVVLLSAFQAPGRAAVVVVDPDAFAAGTDISNSYAGITLSGPGQANSSVYSDEGGGFASTGTRIFFSGDDGLEWGNGFNGGMRADFAVATDFVSIDIIGNDSFSPDRGRLLAFSASDVLLASYATGPLTSTEIETASITRVSPDIAYIVATGNITNDQSIALDNLRFNDVTAGAVPEPATLSIFAVLGASFYLARRKRIAV